MSYNYTWAALNRPGDFPALQESSKPDFDAGINDFSLATAWWMCGFSHLAYHRPDELHAALQPMGMELAASFDIRGMQGYAAKGHVGGLPVGLLALRGTNPFEWNDWRTNLNALTMPAAGGGRVHRGFMQATQRIWGTVGHHLEQWASEGIPLYYAGHSLGGAMAALADNLLPADAIYTFGMPRVGNAEYCDSQQARPIYRVVDCADVVPHVPPEWLFSYRNPHDLRFLDHEGNYLQAPSAAEVQQRIEAAESAYRRLPSSGRIFTRHLADHAILNYTEGLTRALGL